MPDYNFTAKARIPTRPLSYEDKDLAEAKELVVDYINGRVYVCDVNKKLVDITSSVTTVVEEVIKEIQKDPSSMEDVVKDTTISLPSGDTVTIEAGLIDALTRIKELEDALGIIKDEQGKITLKVKASDVETDDNMQFVSKKEKETWTAKADISQTTTTIKGGESNWTATEEDGDTFYTQNVTVADITVDDYPVVDVQLSDVYKTAMEQLNNYAYIYKILTYNGSIKIYAVKPTEVDLTIVMKIDR